MKSTVLLSIVSVALVAVGCVSAGGGAIENVNTAQSKAIDDANMGLSKTSVFDTPTPEPFSYGGSGEALPVAFAGAPPQIPHAIDNYLPLTTDSNQCMGCHDQPTMIGRKAKGMPTPMPQSHYTDLRRAPDKVSKKVIGSRFVCTQCHVPQADVSPLVENTSENSGK
jgi:cytochrome c-type protein NapB